jgi:hypothetical protein
LYHRREHEVSILRLLVHHVDLQPDAKTFEDTDRVFNIKFGDFGVFFLGFPNKIEDLLVLLFALERAERYSSVFAIIIG